MRILRNTENDRCFPFNGFLAREPYMEIIDIADGEIPEVISEKEKWDTHATEVSKDDLPKDSYERMHWTKIKKLVENSGGDWIDTKTGIEHLRAVDQQEQSA